MNIKLYNLLSTRISSKLGNNIDNIPFKAGYLLAESTYLKSENAELYAAIPGTWKKLRCQYAVLSGRKHFAKIWKKMDINLKIKWSNVAINRKALDAYRIVFDSEMKEMDSLIAEILGR